MKKGLMIFLLVAALLVAELYGLHKRFFAPGERIFARLPYVRVGMPRTQVQALLGKPDTIYVWSSAPSPLVWEYDMGPIAPDAVRVFLVQDTVTAVTYNQ